MSSPSHSRHSPANGQSLNSSNATSAHFAGNVQRLWMSQASANNGQSPKAADTQVPTLLSRSGATSRPSENLPQSMPIRSPNLNRKSISGARTSPSLHHAQAATKRPWTSSENGILDLRIAQDSNRSKRPKLEISDKSGENAAEEATTALPSPPNDRTLLKDVFKAPVEDGDVVSITRTNDLVATPCLQSENPISASKPNRLPLAIDSDERATLLSNLTQTRSPPLEATRTAGSSSIAGTTREALPNSLMENVASQYMSTNNSTSPIDPSQPPNQNYTEHLSGGPRSATSSASFRRLYREVTTRLDWVSEQPTPSSIELARLRLLKQACFSEDEFFLILHQIYCNKSKLTEQRNQSVSIKNGLLVLQRLLAPNDELTTRAILWFCEFGKVLSDADQQRLEGEVWHFLGTLAMLWYQLLSAYPPYKIPPSTFAMMVHIPGLTSVILQQVIFRASLRTSWVGPHDECIEQCESVFADDQQLVQTFLRDRRPDDASIRPTMIRFDKIATQKFLRILFGHQGHSRGQLNTTDVDERSQEATSLNRPDLDMVPRHQQYRAMEMPATRRPRPSFPNLDTQAMGNSYPAQSPRGAVALSPILAGPLSAPPVDGSRSSHALPSPSPSAPAITSNPLTSLPRPIAQSPQVDASRLPDVTAAGGLRQQVAQSPLTMQAFSSPNVDSSSIIAQEQTNHSLTGASPTALERPEFGAQIPPQPHQIWPTMHPARSRPLLPTQQSIQRPQFAQAQYASQTEQAAQLQRSFVPQQNSYVQEHNGTGIGLASASPSHRRISLAPHSSGGQFQQMSIPRNASSSAFPASGQPRISQTTRSFSRENNEDFGSPMYRPTVRSSVAPHPATASGSMGHIQAFNPQPHMGFTDQLVRNMNASLPQIPNPAATAVPQAHATSPRLEFWNHDKPHQEIKSFRYINHISFRGTFSASMRSLQWEDVIENKIMIEKLPRDIAGPTGLPFRQVWNGSYLARIRCIKLTSDTLPTMSQWAMSDMSWPTSITMSVNGVLLQIRQKSHVGKDLPIDVTGILKLGRNTFKASALGLPVDCTHKWLIGLELVEVVDAPRIKHLLTFQLHLYCRNRVLEKLRSRDLEVEVVKPQTVLDMTDPFTSRIFDTPIRGKSCAHNQCFDLDTFLQTRGTMSSSEPCSPEEFRCPICKGDVRPHEMVVDGFLSFIRSELEKRGRLDVKAVILHESGEWEIKEEQENVRDDSDENSNGPRLGPDQESIDQSVPMKARSKGKEKATNDVIVLDDD